MSQSERTYLDTLTIQPEILEVEITFIEKKVEKYGSELPLNLLTQEEVAQQLKEFKNIEYRKLEFANPDKKLKKYANKYQLTINDFETFQVIKRNILEHTVYKISKYHKERISEIEDQFVKEMNAECIEKFRKEFSLNITNQLEIVEIENNQSMKSQIGESSGSFGILKEPFYEGIDEKYIVQEDGSFRWIRKILVRTVE